MAVSGTLDPENLDNDIDGKAGGAAWFGCSPIAGTERMGMSNVLMEQGRFVCAFACEEHVHPTWRVLWEAKSVGLGKRVARASLLFFFGDESHDACSLP
jgi:hypothetical protein